MNNSLDFFYDNLGWIVLFIVGATLLLVAIVLGEKEADRLMKQCMEDGKKEYECRALIKQGDTTYIPIVIPAR